MSKGKKFEAAEKYFHKKEVEYRKRIRGLEFQVHTLCMLIEKMRADNENLTEKVKKLEEENIQLKRLHGLSDSDVKELVSDAKRTNENINLLRSFVRSETFQKYI